MTPHRTPRRTSGDDRPTALAEAVRGRRRITIRPAEATDETALRRLAALAGRPLPGGLLTLVETEHGVVAAMGDTGAVADPFRVTADLVELLELRTAQLAA